MVTLEVIEDEEVIQLWKKSLFFHLLHKPLNHFVLLSSQIVGFFDHQYLWKEAINDLDFLHRDNNQIK